MKILALVMAVGLSVCAVRCEAQINPPAQPKLTQAQIEAARARDITLKAEIQAAEAREITLKTATCVKENLTGITQVFISIEELPPEFKGIISEDDLRTAIELRCRSLGLRITEHSSLTDPMLHFNINAISTADITAYNISVDLGEDVILVRDMKKLIPLASVWRTGGIWCIVHILTQCGQ